MTDDSGSINHRTETDERRNLNSNNLLCTFFSFFSFFSFFDFFSFFSFLRFLPASPPPTIPIPSSSSPPSPSSSLPLPLLSSGGAYRSTPLLMSYLWWAEGRGYMEGGLLVAVVVLKVVVS